MVFIPDNTLTKQQTPKKEFSQQFIVGYRLLIGINTQLSVGRNLLRFLSFNCALALPKLKLTT